MANRNVKVTLSAQVQEYVQGMREAADKTREVGSEAEKLAQKREAFQQVGAAAVAMGAAAAVGVGLAISKWADFDQAMSNVQAATHESASNMQLLSDAALEAGARTVFSAEEAANAIEELAKAGVSTADILNGGLDGALDLAAAGGLGVAEAAGIAATALKTFNLEGTDMSHVADLLAAGAGKAMGDVTDLSSALNQSAMVANATGLSIEETTAALSAFASQGLLGSDAGTSFKSMLQSLTPTSAAAKAKMEELGISAYDAQGNFVGLTQFAGSLQNGLKNLSVEQQQAALKTIFGSDAIRAATVLYSEGAEGIQEWINAVDDQGYAAETAAARLDNLKGDIEALGGALDTALIKTGSGANDALRSMVQFVTEAVDAYNDLPAPLQSAALAAGVVAAAVGLLGGGLLLAIPQIAQFKVALTTLGITAQAASGSLLAVGRFLTGPWGVALMAAAAVTTLLVTENQKLSAQSRELADTLDSTTGAITENSTAWAANQLQTEGVLSAAKRMGISADDMTQAWLGNEDALGRVNDRLNKFRKDADFRMENADWKGWSDDLASLDYALDGSNKVLSEAKTRHDELKEATEGSGDAAEGSVSAVDDQTSALEALAGQANDTSQDVSSLADEIRGFGSAQFDTERAAIAFQDALADLDEQMNSGAASLDITTQAGRDTANALLDTAAAANENAASIAAVGGSTEEIQGALESGRQKIIASRVALGESREAAEKYANQLISTPEAVRTRVELSGIGAAQASIDEFIRANSQKRINIAVGAGGQGGQVVGNANGGVYESGVKAFAAGGFEPGIYPYTPGGIHKFAEEYGEAYISMDPARRERSVGVWQETGERLGVFSEMRKIVAQVADRGPTSLSQHNEIHMYDRDERAFLKRAGKALTEGIGFQ